MLSPEQIEIRRTRIGGSDIGAILSIDPHRGPLDVFMDKTAPEASTSPFLEWGSAVESSILAYHAKAEGLEITNPGTLIHPDHAFICATPDGIGARGDADPIVIEAKNVGRWASSDWGEEGDDCPFHYLAQVQWELGVAIRLGMSGKTAHLVAAIAGEPPRKYEIPFDGELFGILADKAAQFVRDHLSIGKPPDGAPADVATYLRRRFPREAAPMLQPSDTLIALVERVREARAATKAAETVQKAAENELKATLGDAAGVVGLCTYKTQKGSTFQVTKEPARVLRLAKEK